MGGEKATNLLVIRVVFFIFLFIILISSNISAEEADTFRINMGLIDSIEEDGDYNLIREYLEMDADLNSMVAYRGDALSSAAKYKRDKKIIKLLLDYGAEVEAIDLVEFILYGAEIEVLELLVEASPNLNKKA